MKEFNVKGLMTTLKANPGYMENLPNVYLKKESPTEFFRLFSPTASPENFRQKYDAFNDRIIHKLKKPLTLFVTTEAKRLLEVQREETLNALRRPSLNADIICPRKTEKSRNPGQNHQTMAEEKSPHPDRNSLQQ